MIGTHDGLEGAVNLIQVSGSESLDKTAFMAMLTPAQLALCDETKTSMKGKLTMNGSPPPEDPEPSRRCCVEGGGCHGDLQTRTGQPDRIAPRADARHQARAHAVLAKQARPEGGRMGVPSAQSTTRCSARRRRRHHRCHHVEADGGNKHGVQSEIGQGTLPQRVCCLHDQNPTRFVWTSTRKKIPPMKAPYCRGRAGWIPTLM